MGKYTFDQIYWALENGFLNLTDTTPTPMGAGDVHQALNPCHGDMEVPKPVKVDKIEYTSDSILPNYDVSYTEKMEKGSGMFPNDDGMDYRDPFLMLAIFPHKTCTGTWGGGAGTYGQITGNFSTFDDLSSIMLQYGMTDGVTPINRCLNGVVLSEYQLGFKIGSILKEKAHLEAAFSSPNTRAFSSNANFDNGQWSLWALKGAAKKTYSPPVIKVYWDDAHAAEFAGLTIQECVMIIKSPRALEMAASQLYIQEEWRQNLVFEAVVKGIMKGNTEYLELEKDFKDKIKKDLRMIWDSTANENKYLEFDNAFINKLDGYRIPSKANVRKVSFTLLGSACKYEGNFNNKPDPSSRIDTT